MTEHLNLRPHSIVRGDRADGSILLRSGYDLGPVAATTSDWVQHWAVATPNRTFLAERSGAGWRTISYGETWQRLRAIAAGLLEMDLGPEAPLMILSGNSIDHGLVSLAAHHVGIPTVPVAEQYALIPEAHSRLQYVDNLVSPGAVFAADPEPYGSAIALLGRPAISSGGGGGTTALDDLTGAADVEAAHAGVGPDTTAKILMTSGSTSDPKGVVTTQRMMTVNQAQIAACMPFLGTRPPVLVDWLPWNHTFGGSHNFNMVLANGGTLYIDDGKPLPHLFPRTLENLRLVSGTISFNVPVGFSQLVNALREDRALRRAYFAKLDMIFYAGSSLPQNTWAALEDLAMQELGRLPLITTSWGLTETAPAAITQYTPAKGAGIIGVPLPGVMVKLTDEGEGRYAASVKGENVFPAYHRNPGKTAAAFDAEGYFVTGDAMSFVDATDMSQGLRFEGRLSENFKLTNGTWVQAASLRLELLSLLAPLAQDVVICGAGRDALAILIVPNLAAFDVAEMALDLANPLAVSQRAFAALAKRLQPAAAVARGSAKRITKCAILSYPPSLALGEVTAKGNINYSKLLEARAVLVDRLYSDDPAVLNLS